LWHGTKTATLHSGQLISAETLPADWEAPTVRDCANGFWASWRVLSDLFEIA
jgi:hypothetical protein